MEFCKCFTSNSGRVSCMASIRFNSTIAFLYWMQNQFVITAHSWNTRENGQATDVYIDMLTFISNGQSTRTAQKKTRKKLKLWNCDNKRKIKSELVYTIFMINNEWNRKWRWKDVHLSNVPRGQKIQYFYKLVL